LQLRVVKVPERYIIIGPDQGNFAKLLLIGTVQKEDSPLFGQTIILPRGFARSAHLTDGAPRVCRYAEISVREGSEVCGSRARHAYYGARPKAPSWWYC
jgi:hypothetical protein